MVAPILTLLGRLFLGGYFLFLAYGRILTVGPSIARLTHSGVPFARAIFWVGLAVQVLGGLLLFLGTRTKLGAYLLASYMIASTYYLQILYVDHVSPGGVARSLALLGGLFYAATFGAGRFSLDGK